METPTVLLTFESVDEVLWCDHSNETSSAALSHGTVVISIDQKYFTK